MKKQIQFLLYVLCMNVCFSQPNVTIIANNLNAPIGIEIDGDHNVWIAEQGIGNNTGSITVVWKDGTVQKVIDSLISIPNPIEGGFTGPERVQFINEDMLVVLGHVDTTFGSFGLMFFDRNSIVKGGSTLLLKDALSIIPTTKEIIRRGNKESHTFSLLTEGCDMLITDAAANAIIRRDGLTGMYTTFSTFPVSTNPTPVGPPFIDAVPTKTVVNPDGGYYTSTLSGFPFVDGMAKVYKVNTDGSNEVFKDNLTMLTDIVASPDGDGVYALQMANVRFDDPTFFVINSGLVSHIHEDGSMDTIFSGFGPTAGLATDEEDNCYLTHLFFGIAIKVEGKKTKVIDPNNNNTDFKIYPNPTSDILNLQITSNSNSIICITDTQGKIIMQPTNLVENNFQINISHFPKGNYFCNILNGYGTQTLQFTKN